MLHWIHSPGLTADWGKPWYSGIPYAGNSPGERERETDTQWTQSLHQYMLKEKISCNREWTYISFSTIPLNSSERYIHVYTCILVFENMQLLEHYWHLELTLDNMHTHTHTHRPQRVPGGVFPLSSPTAGPLGYWHSQTAPSPHEVNTAHQSTVQSNTTAGLISTATHTYNNTIACSGYCQDTLRILSGYYQDILSIIHSVYINALNTGYLRISQDISGYSMCLHITQHNVMFAMTPAPYSCPFTGIVAHGPLPTTLHSVQ